MEKQASKAYPPIGDSHETKEPFAQLGSLGKLKWKRVAVVDGHERLTLALADHGVHSSVNLILLYSRNRQRLRQTIHCVNGLRTATVAKQRPSSQS